MKSSKRYVPDRTPVICSGWRELLLYVVVAVAALVIMRAAGLW